MTSAMTRRLYVIAWLMLGTISLVYFFTLFQSTRGPETAQISPSPFTRLKTGGGPAGTTDPSLSQALVRMRSEIDLLKGSLEAANKENFALRAHIKTLETAFGPPTSALPPEPVKPDPSAQDKDVASRSAPAPKVDITLLDMPASGFAVNFPGAPLPIAGQTAPKRMLFAVELATGLKAADVDVTWRELRRRYPKLLDKLQSRSVKVSAGAPGSADSHKLVAGPFENAAAAARLCARLSAAGAKCQGAVFSGKAVGNVAAR